MTTRYENIAFYSKVSAQSVVTHKVKPGAGETWQIYRFIGGATYSSDARVCLVWNIGGTPEQLRSTHGDVDLSVQHSVVGDGTKELAIVLTNDSLVEKSLGGSFEARVD